MKILKYIALLSLTILGCEKEDDQCDKRIYRFIENNKVYEYKYNGTQLTMIIEPSGEICNLAYTDSLITYEKHDNRTITEHGYYKLNKSGNAIFKCSYRSEDTTYTKYRYNIDHYLFADSTWNRKTSSYKMYMLGDLMLEGKNYSNYAYETFISWDSQKNMDNYSNYINWSNQGLPFLGRSNINLPIMENIIKSSQTRSYEDSILILTNTSSYYYFVDYVYKFDSKNRIIERKKFFRNLYSIVDSSSIKIEYFN